MKVNNLMEKDLRYILYVPMYVFLSISYKHKLSMGTCKKVITKIKNKPISFLKANYKKLETF